MKKPSLEEVKKHFKDAKIVKNNIDIFEIKFLNRIIPGENIKSSYFYRENGDKKALWQDEYGYAEILEYKPNNKPIKKDMKKVIRLDDTKKEKPVKLTHFQHPTNGWVEDDDMEDIEKMVYLGKCAEDGDIFAVYYSGDIISIQKGYLNDGVY